MKKKGHKKKEEVYRDSVGGAETGSAGRERLVTYFQFLCYYYSQTMAPYRLLSIRQLPYMCVCERQEEEERQVSVLLLPFLFRKYRTAPIIGKG